MSDDRVAVYIDFDNVVISRYDDVHGKGTWKSDNARTFDWASGQGLVEQKLKSAVVDIGAIIDYATSFGSVSLSRAYADWSVPANAAYRHPLVDRSIDLVQLFSTSGTKNGADIRLSVDAVEDLVLHPEITHVVFVAGDSDYIPLAQRCKRMGRYVVGIGVSGSTSKALVSACDDFSYYGDVPGVVTPKPVAAVPASAEPPPVAKTASGKKAAAAKAPAKKAMKATKKTAASSESPAQAEATQLLVRAIEVGSGKSDDGWLHAGGVKSVMQRMNPAFKEKALGYSSFAAFVESRSSVVESKSHNGQYSVRVR